MVSYELIKTEFEEIGRKVSQIIGLRDVMISTNSKAHIDDITKLFDVNITTPTEIDMENGGRITITLKMPLNIEKILIIADEDTGWENISFTATYDDGSQDTGSLTSVSGVGSKVGLDHSNKLYKLVLFNNSGTKYTFNVREMIFYFSYLYLAELTGGDNELGAVEIKDADSDTRAKVDSDKALRTGVYDTSGARIDPATNEKIDEKIPQPLAFDSDGRVKVNADLQVADIEIGAVEIKDGDSDTRAKVDTDKAVIAGLNNTSGTRINPATDDLIKTMKDLIFIPATIKGYYASYITVSGSGSGIHNADSTYMRHSVGLSQNNTLTFNFSGIKVGILLGFGDFDYTITDSAGDKTGTISFSSGNNNFALIEGLTDESHTLTLKYTSSAPSYVEGFFVEANKNLALFNSPIVDYLQEIINDIVANSTYVNRLHPNDGHISESVSVTTTTTQLSTSDLSQNGVIRDEITLYADNNNTDTIFVGNSSSNTPFPLGPGDILTLKKISIQKIFVKANSGTQTLYVESGGGW